MNKIAEFYYQPEKEKIHLNIIHNEKTFGYSGMREIYRKMKHEIDFKLDELNKEINKNALEKTLQKM